MPDPSAVIYYAHRRVRETDGKVFYFHASPNKWWVELHGKDPIVIVRLRERTNTDPPSNYWGWLDVKHPNKFLFVWPSEAQLNMCFPYGPEAEEARGRGRKVNLVVEELTGA